MRFIPCPIKKQALKNASHPAIICNDAALTYKELDLAIDGCAHKLRRIGVKKKDRICILSPASIEYIIALFALWRSGAVSCLLNEGLPENILSQEIKNIQGKVILNHTRSAPRDFHILCVPLESVAAKDTPPATIKNVRYACDQPATILFTSGSSHQPKAVQHSMGNHYYNALGSNGNISLEENDRWLVSLPLYHVSGLSILFRCFLAGAAVVVLRKNNNVCSLIEKFKVTHISFVTTQLHRALDTPESRGALKRLKALLIGGSAVHEQLLEKARGEKLPVYLSYGLTEMASQVATTTILKDNIKSLKAKVLPYRKVRITSDGEILVAGKTLFQGYIKNGVLKPATDKNGWFHTGDIGSLGKGRRLVVRGRKDTMFISGGENIFPEEIEYFLSKCALVEDALVVAKPDQEYGFRPVAFIKQRTNKRIRSSLFVSYLRKYLPTFKIPDIFYLWPKGVPSNGIKANRAFFRQLLQEKKKKLQLLA